MFQIIGPVAIATEIAKDSTALSVLTTSAVVGGSLVIGCAAHSLAKGRVVGPEEMLNDTWETTKNFGKSGVVYFASTSQEALRHFTNDDSDDNVVDLDAVRKSTHKHRERARQERALGVHPAIANLTDLEFERLWDELLDPEDSESEE